MSVNSKMTALADEIRELSGTSEAIGLDAMKTHINEANDEVASQVELLAQVVAALEGKAGGSGGGNSELVKQIIDGTVIEVSDSDIKSIKKYLFCDCRSLITANFPQVTNIGTHAFDICESLTTVSFPACTTIELGAFNNCNSLIAANFPACTTIGPQVFRGCDSLTTANFPQVTTLESETFFGCGSLITANFPQVTTIGSMAFQGCKSLSTINSPVCKTILPNAFGYCQSLTTVSFPQAITIWHNAFEYCYNLSSANFPQAIHIDAEAFTNCSNLTTVSFPQVMTIESKAFHNCSRLTSVFLPKTAVVKLSNSNAFSYTTMSTMGQFYVPSSLIASYQTATNWAYYSSRFSAIEDSADWDGIYGVEYRKHISFTINGVSYAALDGMTWYDWFISDYNTNNVSTNWLQICGIQNLNELIKDGSVYNDMYGGGGN